MSHAASPALPPGIPTDPLSDDTRQALARLEEDVTGGAVESLPDLSGALGRLQARLALRLATPGGDRTSQDGFSITVEQLGTRVQKSADWLYRHWRDEFPYGFLVGGEVRFRLEDVNRDLAKRARRKA